MPFVKVSDLLDARLFVCQIQLQSGLLKTNEVVTDYENAELLSMVERGYENFEALEKVSNLLDA